ncbi:MAG TPA: gamma-glutamyl-gamma-aminobutyrate hydrolase family protein, partial [Gemmatimonadaceae bacterium]|nr:gamma-glutamyl-gamma-aminobutyrate hydrolase family protein [Gemmatimonadaceae bacterium]
TERTHAVTFVAGSRLAGIFGPSGSVNSMHHQAVARPATGLAVTAVAPDGIVEGVEWTRDRWWAVGIQWHPEELDGCDRGLFAALVEAARGEISPPSATAPRPQPAA